MANTNLTIDMITKEALRILHNNLGFTKTVTRQYQDEFARSGAKIGTVLRIRKPNRFPVVTGAALSTTDVTEENTTLTVATQKHVDVTFTSQELTMELDDFSKRILNPAMAKLASTIDFDGLSEFKKVYHSVGTPGTTPASALVWLQGAQKLSEHAVPMNDRYVCMNPAANAATVDALKGLFHAGTSISSQFRKGVMGNNVLGYDEMIMDQNINVFTRSAANGAYLVNGAAQSGATLTVDTGANAPSEGEVFTIAGVNSVNPETGQDTGALAQFVVGTGATTTSWPIDPPITASGAKQTVTAAPADDAAITFVGTASTAYPQNLVYQMDAFTLATVDLEMPDGVDMARRAVYDGISLRIVRQYDINTDKFPCRIDVLYGWATVRPEMACRVWG